MARAAILFAAFFCITGRAASIEVVVVNAAGIPAAAVQKASAVAERIFRQSGLDTEWVPGGSAAVQPGPGRLVVRILGKGMADPDLPGHVLGTTNREHETAYIFYARVGVSPLGDLGNRFALLGSV